MNSKYYSKALNNSIEHLKSYKKDSTKNEILTVVNMFLVASTGIANNIDDSFLTKTILSIVLYISLFVTAVQKYYDFSQSSEKHRIMSILYKTLSENIENEKVPIEYIINQHQLLRAIGPGLVENENLTFLTGTVVDLGSETENKRDREFDFELSRMNNI